ncbi:MAG: NBR1-Ig-like domain-containing protein [Anaerolineales bacterium]
MSRFSKITWLWIAFLLVGLAACGGAGPTADPALAFTQIWQTVEVAQAATALAASQTPSNTATPAVSLTPHASNTPLLTSTSLPGVPSLTPKSTLTPASTQTSACDNAQFITDVTFPDGSDVVANSLFVKTWRVKNLGPCTWNPNYRLIFGWGGVGTNWNTVQPSPFNATVLPGESLEISVTLKAPETPGNYSAAFRLQNDKGFNFSDYLTVVVTAK